MVNFVKDLISFIGRRIDGNKNHLKASLMEESKIDCRHLDEEEIGNVDEALEKEAAYLCGFGDGIRLGLLIVEKGRHYI